MHSLVSHGWAPYSVQWLCLLLGLDVPEQALGLYIVHVSPPSIMLQVVVESYNDLHDSLSEVERLLFQHKLQETEKVCTCTVSSKFSWHNIFVNFMIEVVIMKILLTEIKIRANFMRFTKF